jgi:hypothetical protein
LAGTVWKAAIKHLAKGRALHQNSLVSLVKHETGVAEPTVAHHLSSGFAGAIRVGGYYDLRAEYRLRLTLTSLLPDMTRTPAGNLRTGAISLEVSGRHGTITARIEVVDDEAAYWFCVRACDPTTWAALRDEAETPSADWTLPWRPAPTAAQTLPALLAWRSADLSATIAAACNVAAALQIKSADTVKLRILAAPPKRFPDLAAEERTIERLTRRRGAIPSGRTHPVQGWCDHCGQPLSDPYSLLVGIGPVCRQYYSPRVLSAVARARSPVDSSSSVSRRTPADALARLAQDWA